MEQYEKCILAVFTQVFTIAEDELIEFFSVFLRYIHVFQLHINIKLVKRY